MTRALVASVVCLVWLAHPARVWAQSTPIVKPGQQVRITETTGGTITGRVSAVGADTVTVDGRAFSFDRIERLERKGDSLWNGLAIGAAVGLFLPLLPTEACMNQSRAGCIASGIETGALLGLAFDALHRGYTTVKFDRHVRSVAVSLQF